MPNSPPYGMYHFSLSPSIYGSSLSSHSLAINVLSSLEVFANQIVEKWHLSIILVCISFIMGELEHYYIFKGPLCIFFHELPAHIFYYLAGF